MADVAEMWRNVHVHGAYSIVDMWMAATICRRPKLPGLYWERPLFLIRLFCKRDMAIEGNHKLLPPLFAKMWMVDSVLQRCR